MKRRDLLTLAAASIPLIMASRQAWANTGGRAWTTLKPDSLYEPTRYAFVADKGSNFIAVADIISGEAVDVLNPGFRPKVMEIARDAPMLAAASPEVSALYLLDLKTRQARTIKLPSPVYQIFFVPQSTLMAIGMRDQVGLIDYAKDTVKVFPERFDSDQRQTVLNTYYSLLFSSFSQSFWVLDEERPRILRKRGDDPVDKPWEIIDLSRHVKSGSGLGIGVASPEDFLIAFTVDDGSEGLIYFPEDGRVLSTGPMRTAGTTNEPMIMPYIDAYSRNVMFGDVEGNMASFDLRQADPKPQRYTLDFSPRIIRSGWLESTWIIGGDKAILFQSFDNPEDRRIYRFAPEVVSMWVTGDSKTALVTLDEGTAQLYRYDIRSREQRDPIPLRGVVMGEAIRMGSNNSICY